MAARQQPGCDPFHGRGLGRDAVRTLARHRSTIAATIGWSSIPRPPTTSIRCYSAVGRRPIGVMRPYGPDTDGDGWHDGLLMDLLVPEFT